MSYTVVFAVAAIACYGSAWRASQITDDDIKRGLVGLLLLSGTWAAASVGRLVAPTSELQVTSYMIGLVVGLGTVGAWLYFCSAYAGYDYHTQTSFRQVALVVYLVIASIKLTNPLHSLYFTTASTTVPFRHIAIFLSPFHWVITAFAYSLTAVGFYILYELFRDSKFDTTKLWVLASLTALPVVADVIAFTNLAPNLILPFNYEPIGVALFAVGVLFVVDETFVAVPQTWRKKLVAQFDNPIILLTTDGHIRDFNDATMKHFPAVKDALGSSLETVAPPLHAAVESAEKIFEYSTENTARFYTLQTQPLVRGTHSVGRAIIFKDITAIEQHRRELQRQNNQLNDFSTALNHELRNAITVVHGFIEHASQSTTHGRADIGPESIVRANNAIDRMQRVISDLSTLARYGQTPDDITDCDLQTTVETAWEQVETERMTYSVETDAIIAANQPRVEVLFRDAFRFAQANEATEVTIEMTGDTLTITDNGTPLSPDVVDDAFEFGPPVPTGDADMALPKIRLLSRVHEWTATIDQSYTNGVRIQISGVTVKS